ncbi:MAG: glycosyl hydrolase 108 family protein [Paludibacter sp.]|nr:glycosyl hydrolase 108 family protein [Paludibacter sp.]
MANFNISLQKTLHHEGIYSNDPADLGKETFRGISRANYNNWAGWKLIDQMKSKPDFPSNLNCNVEMQKQVEIFYLHEFWIPLKAEFILNQDSADSLFDFAVNTGIKTSVQLAQSVIGVKTDGLIGELTLKKINTIDFGYFQPAFTVGKISHYIASIQKQPTNKKYLYGWIIRTLEYHS